VSEDFGDRAIQRVARSPGQRQKQIQQKTVFFVSAEFRRKTVSKNKMAAGLFLKLAVLCLAATADATDATTTTLNLDALISNLKSLKRDSQYCDDSRNGHGQVMPETGVLSNH
jgi:hypothetical protein